jgi:adenylate cyclase class 2
MPETKNIETEIKIKIDNIEEFVNLLISKKASYQGRDFQRTTRIDTPNLDLQKKSIFLRVRSGLGNTVTLKVKKEENKNFKLRDEYETEVKDISILSEIFSILGFDRHFIMEKYRANFSLGGLEISVDELPFGIFAEFEGSQEEINKVVKELGLEASERITVTYWHIFDEYKKERGLTDENIVFPEGYESRIMKLDLAKNKNY